MELSLSAEDRRTPMRMISDTCRTGCINAPALSAAFGGLIRTLREASCLGRLLGRAFLLLFGVATRCSGVTTNDF